MFWITSILLEKLNPSAVHKHSCQAAGEKYTLELTHQDKNYHFSIAIETLDETRVYANAKDSTGKEFRVGYNSRSVLSKVAVGTVTVEIECTKPGIKDKMIYVSYLDNYLLENNERFSTVLHMMNNGYMMVPVCHEKKDITINTNAKIFASFDNARPDDNSPMNNKDTKTNFVIPAANIVIPGYIFIHFSYVQGTEAGFVQIFQIPTRVFTTNIELETQMSSQQYCSAHFTIAVAADDDHLIMAAADNDMQMQYSAPVIYFQSTYTDVHLAGPDNYVVSSDDGNVNDGICDVDPKKYPEVYKQKNPNDIAVQIGLNTAYLPVTHKIMQNYTNYAFSLFVSHNATYVFPGFQKEFKLPAHDENIKDIVIPFKETNQFSLTNQEMDRTAVKYSDYIVDFQSLMMDQIDIVTYGWGNTSAIQGQVTKTGDNRYVGIVKFDEEHTAGKFGELYYMRAHKKPAAEGQQDFVGFVKAEHSFKFTERVQYNYKPLEGQADHMFYGHFNPKAENGMTLQVDLMDGQPNVKIFLSQTEYLPSPQAFDHTFECNDLCTIRVTSDMVKADKNIYIGFETVGGITVIAAEEDDIVTQVYEYQTTKGALTILTGEENQIYKQEYVFIPYFKNYQKEYRENEFTIVTLDVDQSSLNILAKNNIDIGVAINTIPGPEREQNSTMMHMSDGIAFNVEGKIDARKHRVVRMPAGQKIFITVMCQGMNCGKNTTNKAKIRFDLTVNTLSKIPDSTMWGGFSTPLRDDPEMPETYFFRQNDEELATLHIYNPLPRFETDLSQTCAGIGTRVYACTGTMPSKKDILDINHMMSCEHFNITSDEVYGTLQLDASNDKVSSGNVFVVLIPDFTNYQGKKEHLSDCEFFIDMYRNEQISHFNRLYHADLNLGYGVENAKYFMADVPIITSHQATATEYGDRMVLQFESKYKIRVCLTDDPEVFYPKPTETGNGSCDTYYTVTPTQNDEVAINFNKYMNEPNSGKIQPVTRVFFGIWADDVVPHDHEGEGFVVNLTVVPQAYIGLGQSASFFFNANSLKGNDEFVSVAIDVSKFNTTVLSDASIIAGPECNNPRCRENTPDEFYSKSIMTFVSTTHMSPDSHTFSLHNSEAGVQILPLEDLFENEMRQIKTIYVTIEYLKSHLLDLKKAKSSIPYSITMQLKYGNSNLLAYQTTTPVTKHLLNKSPIDYFHAVMPYNPSEIIIFPCKGKPALLLDQISPLSTPQAGDYKELLTASWGRPIVKRFLNDSLLMINEFISVFDEAMYDYQKKQFISSQSQMSYQIFVGSQSEICTPGNNGKLTIVKYDNSGNGKIKVRFSPARQPNQNGNVSGVDYRMYVIPYAGTYDPEVDFSPYTTCGVINSGYSIYKNADEIDAIDYDPVKVTKDGYIEVESNMDLWQFNNPKQSVLYLTILVDEITYQGVLVGDGTLSIQVFMSISLIITVVVAACLFLLFWALFVRVKLMKQKGYQQQFNEDND